LDVRELYLYTYPAIHLPIDPFTIFLLYIKLFEALNESEVISKEFFAIRTNPLLLRLLHFY
jgi:hypothetical protein